MKLVIDLADPVVVRLSLQSDQQTAHHEFVAERNLSDRLIVEIKKFLQQQKIQPSQITTIQTDPGHGGFSRIRTSIATANALAFGLNLKQKPIQPQYDRAPNITRAKST